MPVCVVLQPLATVATLSHKLTNVQVHQTLSHWVAWLLRALNIRMFGGS